MKTLEEMSKNAKKTLEEILKTGNNREKILAAKEILKITGPEVNERPFAHLSDKELRDSIKEGKKEAREPRMPKEVLEKVTKMEDEVEKLDRKFGTPY